MMLWMIAIFNANVCKGSFYRYCLIACLTIRVVSIIVAFPIAWASLINIAPHRSPLLPCDSHDVQHILIRHRCGDHVSGISVTLDAFMCISLLDRCDVFRNHKVIRHKISFPLSFFLFLCVFVMLNFVISLFAVPHIGKWKYCNWKAVDIWRKTYRLSLSCTKTLILERTSTISRNLRKN